MTLNMRWYRWRERVARASSRTRRALGGAAVLMLAGAGLSACAGSFIGGIGGIFGALALVWVLALSFAGVGCEAGACLSPPRPDRSINVCLSTDAWPFSDVCLSSDTRIPDKGGCLAARDGGVDSTPDAGVDANPVDSKPSASLSPRESLQRQRAQALRKLGDAMPADVHQRLMSNRRPKA